MISAGQRDSGPAGRDVARGKARHRIVLSRWPPVPLPRLRNPEKLMPLEAAPPARVRQAVAQGGVGIGLQLCSIHRLKEEVSKRQALEELRLGAGLGKYQLDLVSGSDHQLRARLWT